MPEETTVVEKDSKPETTTEETTDEDKIVLDDLFPATDHTQVIPKEEPAKPATETDDDKEKRLLDKVERIFEEKIKNSYQSVDKKLSRQSEVTNFLSSEEGKLYAPFAEAIAKVAVDSRFSDLHMDRIVGLALTPKQLLKIGAQLERQSQIESDKTKVGGNSGSSPVTKAKDAWEMSREEFEKKQREVLSGSSAQKR